MPIFQLHPHADAVCAGMSEEETHCLAYEFSACRSFRGSASYAAAGRAIYIPFSPDPHALTLGTRQRQALPNSRSPFPQGCIALTGPIRLIEAAEKIGFARDTNAAPHSMSILAYVVGSEVDSEGLSGSGS